MINEILSGWKNFLTRPEVTENTARHRAKLCAACPNAKRGKLLAFIKDDLTEIQGNYCNLCKCPLSAKVRSNDICPINKW
ncbi:hypothetical protein [Flavobacterium beibuense]|uniref:Uncharacterized protein n=1 Tax=Flavobacterium beibuense TaxID=657326 RepID=A0A444WFA0_9FLAO|nr:hypothetical protein [Flavobacterium beibuense]RYJ44531.1 hypothetical protein NU09_1141 [Flavobacterium beibuense]